MMKKDLYIFGSGGFAKEIYYLALQTGLYDVVAFVDRERCISNDFAKKTIPIINEDDFLDICISKDVSAAIAIANNHVVRSIHEKFSGKCDFPNITHPDVQLLDVEFEGIGNLITYGNFLSFHVCLGSFNRINIGSVIGHDCRIGDYNQINPHCTISGNIKIGNYNLLGAGSTLLQGIKVGDNNVLGIGSVFLKDVESDGIYIGNPARMMGKNTQ